VGVVGWNVTTMEGVELMRYGLRGWEERRSGSWNTKGGVGRLLISWRADVSAGRVGASKEDRYEGEYRLWSSGGNGGREKRVAGSLCTEREGRKLLATVRRRWMPQLGVSAERRGFVQSARNQAVSHRDGGMHSETPPSCLAFFAADWDSRRVFAA
jgi:hypothetical protein